MLNSPPYVIMKMRMSDKQKNLASIAGEWLYRAIAVYFLWNIYTDVQSTNKLLPVHNTKIEDIEKKNDSQDQSIEKINKALFVPVFSLPDRKESVYIHGLETKNLMDITENNIVDANNQLNYVDSMLNFKSN